jgi:hypothetical protein
VLANEALVVAQPTEALLAGLANAIATVVPLASEHLQS